MDSFYDKLLKSPLWKAKRKVILERDGKKCTVCGKKSNLHIHHTYYYKSQYAPWIYPNDSLLTLCQDCHKDYHLHHELEFRDNPPVKTKILKPGVRGKKQRKKKVKREKTPYCKSNPYRAKPCLATTQAQRLGYVKNSWGKWIKPEK